jgi:MFS family permease
VDDKARAVSTLQAPALVGDQDHALIQKVIRRIIPFCILCFLLNYIDRTNIGMAENTMEKSVAGFNKSVFTFGFTLFYIPYCLLEVPSNLIQQKVGARRWIARIMVTWGMVSTCFIFVKGTTLFYTLRVLLGVAEAGFFPGVILYLSYWIPTRYRARATALFVLAQAMAQMIGNTCGGFILFFADKYQLPGQPWQWLFLLEGIPSIIMGFVVLFYLTDKPADAKWLKEEERERLAEIMAADQTEKHSHSASEFKTAMLSPTTWLLSILYSMLVWGYYPVQGFSQVILKPVLVQAGAIVLPPEAPATAAAATATAAATASAVVPTPGHIVSIYLGLLTAIPFAAAAVCMLFFAKHSDKTGERKYHVAFASFLMAAGLAMAALGPAYTTGTTKTVLAVAGLSLSAIGWFCSFAIFWSIPAQLLTGTAVAVSVAIINSVANLVGNFGGPNSRSVVERFVGKADADFWALLLAAGCAFLGTILAATLRLPEKRAQGFEVLMPEKAEK